MRIARPLILPVNASLIVRLVFGWGAISEKEQPGGQQIINQTQTVKMKGVKVGRDFNIAPVQEGGKKT